MKKIVQLLVMVFILACSYDEGPSTAATKIPNRVKGNVVNGAGAVNGGYCIVTSVSIVDYDNNSKSRDTVLIGMDGNFEFEVHDEENYTLQVFSHSYSAIITNITVQDTTYLDDVFVSKPVDVIGRIFNTKGAFAFIPGTDIISSVDSNGVYILQNVPSGSFDILFANDGDLVQLPMNVKPSQETVYVYDVDINSAQKLEMGSDYPTTMSSYIVEPVVYKDTIPEWYENKSFHAVEYKNSNGEIIAIKQPSLKKLLVVLDQKKSKEDQFINTFLTTNGYDVVTVSDSAMRVADTGGVDAIVVTYYADAMDLDSEVTIMLQATEKPVMVMEVSVAKELGMITKVKIVVDTTVVNVIDSTHFITEGYYGELGMFDTTSSILVGEVSSDATKLIKSSSPDSSYPSVYTYEVGDVDLNANVLKGKRVGFHYKGMVFENFTDTGKTLFLRSLQWMCNE